MIPSYFDGKNKDDLNLKKGLKIFVNNYLDNNPIIDPNSTNKFQKKKKIHFEPSEELKKINDFYMHRKQPIERKEKLNYFFLNNKENI